MRLTTSVGFGCRAWWQTSSLQSLGAAGHRHDLVSAMRRGISARAADLRTQNREPVVESGRLPLFVVPSGNDEVNEIADLPR